ncbi:hypothetical protein D3C75_1077230 [compost metagenome]
MDNSAQRFSHCIITEVITRLYSPSRIPNCEEGSRKGSSRIWPMAAMVYQLP